MLLTAGYWSAFYEKTAKKKVNFNDLKFLLFIAFLQIEYRMIVMFFSVLKFWDCENIKKLNEFVLETVIQQRALQVVAS